MDHQTAVTKLAELLKNAHICTLSTISDGQIVSRPMALQSAEFSGDLWFFTYDSSHKIGELQANPQVNVAFESKSSWVSLSGTGEAIHDRQKAEELWSPLLKAWFPQELDEPGLTLLKIHAESAEYWDSNNSKVVSLFGMVKAATTGKRAEGGENETVEL